MDDHKKIAPVQTSQSLPFLMDSPALLRVRILPAEFARLLGISKQCVSVWIRDGKITINPVDGRLDVQAAIQQVLRNTDPGRLRARVLRQAVEDVQGLRDAAAQADARAEALEAGLATAHARIQHLDSYARDMDCMFDLLRDRVLKREAEFRTTPDSAAWAALLDRLEAEIAKLCGEDGE